MYADDIVLLNVSKIGLENSLSLVENYYNMNSRLNYVFNTALKSCHKLNMADEGTIT